MKMGNLIRSRKREIVCFTCHYTVEVENRDTARRIWDRTYFSQKLNITHLSDIFFRGFMGHLLSTSTSSQIAVCCAHPEFDPTRPLAILGTGIVSSWSSLSFQTRLGIHGPSFFAIRTER
ncbi:hypothetical protein FRC03_011427 [Tulasnella sp. 419]|nr:hypothetical protein FRC03_011427 [Tulasnella sp. 419]